MNSYKSKKIKYLEKILRLIAVLVLKKYKPKIVGITGSIGKTSTKEAVFAVLRSGFYARKNEKNYNNEIGLPLTVIGVESGRSSFFDWMKVFLKWISILIFPIKYPEILILEMGADRPGDIKYLTDFIKPEIGIITDVSLSHIEFFNNLNEIAKEKGIMAKVLDENGTAVLNADNPHVFKLKDQLKSNVISYGFSDEATMKATDISYIYSNTNETKGLSFKLNYKGTIIPVRLENVLAKHQIYSALAAVAAGIALGMNLVEAVSALKDFSSPCGRMNLIKGIKNSLIIDDTYNSSPASTFAALEVLKSIKSQRKIAVLGDMLELGKETENGHRNVARKFLEIQGDIFISVGKRMKFAISELEGSGFEREKIFSYLSPYEAAAKIKEIINPGDLILIKGSQGMRMEKIAEEIMLEPQKAEELLCRQNKEWKEKPWKKN